MSTTPVTNRRDSPERRALSLLTSLLPPAKMNAQHVIDWLNETADEVVRLEPRDRYDKHIMGVGYRFGVGPVLCYSYQGIIESHMEDGLTHEEADEYFQVNTLGGWFGEGTPIFLDTLEQSLCPS